MRYSAALKMQIGSAAPMILYFTDHETNQDDTAFSFNISAAQGIVAALVINFFEGETGWFRKLPFAQMMTNPTSISILGDIIDRYGNSSEYEAAEIDLRAFKADTMKTSLKNFLVKQGDMGAPFLPPSADLQNVINKVESTPIGDVQKLLNDSGLGTAITVKSTPTIVKFTPLTDAEFDQLHNSALDLRALHDDAYLSLVKMINFENPQIEAAGWKKVVRKGQSSNPDIVIGSESIEYTVNCSYSVALPAPSEV